jgi:hypothetical protein
MLPSEDDDGSAAEIARLRAAGIDHAERMGRLLLERDDEIARLRTALATAERERDEAHRDRHDHQCMVAGIERDRHARAFAELRAARDTALASLASTRAELEAAMVVVEAVEDWWDEDSYRRRERLRAAVDAFRSRTKEKQP